MEEFRTNWEAFCLSFILSSVGADLFVVAMKEFNYN